MLPDWHFLLDRGVNFRTKRVLLVAGFPEVLQLADVGLTGLAKDGEIFRTAQQKRLILITKDTDFIQQLTYALGHDGIVFVTQSKTEPQDTATALLGLAQQYQTLVNMRFTVWVGGQVRREP